MMQNFRLGRRSAAALVSLLAPFAAACGWSGDDSATPAPPFGGGAPGVVPPADPNATPPGDTTPSGGEGPGDLPLDMTAGQPGTPDLPGPGGTTNLFSELLGIPQADVDAKLTLAANRIFGIGTGESATPIANAGYRLYYELPQDNSQAFIWAADSNDIRSEGMSYGMMIAVQLDMQEQFDRLWNFARTHMQFPADTDLTPWRHYFRWQGSVNTANAADWQVSYAPQTGPAPDGDEYFAAALYLADRRWGSAGAINYEQEADNIASAMLNNQAGDAQRTPIINPTSNMVVFFPQGNSAAFSDPSYHLPAFYEVFAQDGPEADSARWRQVAETSRQYFVTSAHAVTGLHPDYANFNGTPNAGGDTHDDFRFDAWRVVMNMAVDYAWGSQDERLKTQVEKYHTFFGTRLTPGNVQSSLFELDGSGASGNGSTALTATLASGALASTTANRNAFVQNLWDIQQQTGTFRYYQETVYMLGLLSVAGRFDYDFSRAE
jgi:oligosaccharide reducing-end xylanase